jgi:ribulose-phosphate 3-epimerase
VARRSEQPTGALQLAPSILSADFGILDAQLALVDPVTDRVHVDVMDGHFVPNLTVGPPVVASIRQCSTRFFECHLMLTDPLEYLGAFAEAGADACTVHVEVGRTRELVDAARELGIGIGLACNPDTPFEAVAPWLGEVDLVLCMTVFPGFAGQRFIGSVLEKVTAVRAAADAQGIELDVEVDGGIDEVTAPLAVAAGANVLVAGSAIFGAASPLDAARALRRAAGFS